jgi:hypothetical protein
VRTFPVPKGTGENVNALCVNGVNAFVNAWPACMGLFVPAVNGSYTLLPEIGA